MRKTIEIAKEKKTIIVEINPDIYFITNNDPVFNGSVSLPVPWEHNLVSTSRPLNGCLLVHFIIAYFMDANSMLRCI